MVAILNVYVDDIVITGDDSKEVLNLKQYLAQEFEVKDLGFLRYFLGIEVSWGSKGIYLSQRKYILDLLRETGMYGSRPTATPIEQNHKLSSTEGKSVDRERYQRLVGRLIYLSHTHPDIAFTVSVVSQFMHDPKTIHLGAVNRILRYLKDVQGEAYYIQNKEICKSNVIRMLIGEAPWMIGGLLLVIVLMLEEI
jgi:hypothetical protein